MDRRLQQRIRQVGRRMQTTRFVLLTGLFWILIAIVGFGLWSARELGFSSLTSAGIWILGFAAAAVVVAFLIAQLSFPDDQEIARRIEEHFPELDQRLLAAIAQPTTSSHKRVGYLQETVIQQALTHHLHSPWRDVVSAGRIATAWTTTVVGLLLLAGLALAGQFELPTRETVAELIEPEQPTVTTELTIEPGSTEVEKGTGLFVTARFPNDKQQQIPGDVKLVAIDKQGQTKSIAMTRTLDEPLFAAHLSEVTDDFDYRVEFEDNKSSDYSITVFEFPRLVQADVDLKYPEYTSQPDQTINDTLKVTVVEGTATNWQLQLNKPVQTAMLINGEEEIPLQMTDTGTLAAMEQIAVESTKWTLKLVDAKGRENQRPPTLTVRVVPNRAPKLKLVAARDARVSPLEELEIAAKVSDDYGVARYGIAYAIASEPMQDVVLGEKTDPKKTTDIKHQVDFETLEAKPDQLLAYNFWAEDFGPDGQIRRTSGDLFFAEVRHFEEIFRQGEAPSGESAQQQQQQQQNQNAQQAEELAELQKQIMNATWRIVRREVSSELSKSFSEDVSLLIESQQTALGQLSSLMQELQDGESQQYGLQVQTDMLESSQQLINSHESSTAKPLEAALTHQRLAYQGLLRLRAREHDVIQSQQSQSPSSSSSSQSRQQFQQQLEQLQLKNDQDRYETERQAQQQEDQSEREVRQVLNRLKELARRQEDINEQLKDLEAALQAAEDEEERERLNNQLKRLRDQQEQMLRDIDELQNRMQEAENQQAMQAAEEQVQSSRENAQQATEAMQQNDPSKALTAGTRAERELKEVRDRLREETANQFEDTLREMRQQARELEERQTEINENITQEPADAENQTPGLRSTKSTPDEETKTQLAEQRQQLEQLLKAMQETVTDAEPSEPLLSQKLYDALRDTFRRRLPEQISTTETLLERGMRPQAEQLAESISEGIEQLRHDVEDAAQSVLGDETEGLRRALTEIDQIADQLQNEINRNNPSEQDAAETARDEQSQSENQDRPDVGSQSAQNPNDQPTGNQQASSNQQTDQQDGETAPRESAPEESASNETREGQPSQTSGQSSGSQPSESESNQTDSGQPQNQQAGSQPSDSQQPSDTPDQPPGEQLNQTSGQNDSQRREQNSSGRPSLRDSSNQQRPNQASAGGGLDRFIQDARETSPITGSEFREWSDRLRDVEEMVEDPKLRAEAAEIRDRARGFRQEFVRHSKEPRWDLVRELVAVPLQELRIQVSQELLRRSAKKNEVVPIDRDPVPRRFTRQVDEYYEKLGIGDDEGRVQ